MTKKVISTRMSPNELAKARDGLLSKGIDPIQLDNVSQILRLTFYYGLMTICKDPKSSPSKESMTFINQRIGQSKTGTAISLDDIITNKK